jgi:hypothetical protein
MKILDGMKNLSKLATLFKEVYSYTKEYSSSYGESSDLESLLRVHSEEKIPEGLRKSTMSMAYSLRYVGDSYAKLFNVDLSAAQKNTLLILGALARLQDTLIDDYENVISTEEYRLFYTPEEYHPKTSVDSAAQRLFIELRKSTPRNTNPILHDTLEKLFHVQIESKRQKISNDIIFLKDVTEKKGGYANLAIAVIVKPDMSIEEQKMVYNFGFYQYVDDIFDREEDTRDGIHTLATELPPDKMRDVLISARDRALSEMASFPYERKLKESAIFKNYVYTLPAILKLNRTPNNKAFRFAPRTRSRINFMIRCFGEGLHYDPTDYGL